MSVTRTSLRRSLALDTAGELFVYGTTTAATTTTFTLTELVDDGATSETSEKYVGAWAYVPSTGDERRIVAYTASTGSCSAHRPFSSAPTTTVVEIHRWPPSLVHQAINDGLSRAKYIDAQVIPLVADTPDYSLAAYTWITNPADVLAVYLQDAANNPPGFSPVPVQWFKVRQDGSTLTLWVDPPSRDATTYELLVETLRGYGPLTAEADTAAIDALWARAAARVALYDILISRTAPNVEKEHLIAAREDARKAFRRYSRLNQPRVGQKVMLNTPDFGRPALQRRPGAFWGT